MATFDARQEHSILVDESLRQLLKMTEEDSRYGYFILRRRCAGRRVRVAASRNGALRR